MIAASRLCSVLMLIKAVYSLSNGNKDTAHHAGPLVLLIDWSAVH